MNADRNLLFGILALQNDFVTRDELVAAMNEWVLEKQTSLGEILRRRGALAEDVFGLLDALVDKQIAKHHGDVQASIAALSSVSNARSALKEINDEQVQATLRTLQPPADGGMPGTEPFFGKSADEAGRFTILRPHAAGGLGEVFVAKDNELDREVALKQIKEQYSQSSQSQSRFKLEAEVTGGLEHPGIVPVYSLGAYADGRPFYAMRFIRGDSLKEAIDRFHSRSGGSPDFTSLEFRGLLRRFIDVCNAIAYAHSRGILHRDLKPGNIMLGKYGETLVVDWGLAKAMGSTPNDHDMSQGPLMPPSASGSGYEATAPGSAIGTPAYMSPEQAEGKLDQLGPATDVYSLGGTLYTVLTGQPPYLGKAIIEILECVRQGKFTLPRSLQPALPQAIDAICLKAMALKPADRYSSALELANDLEHWLADEPVTACDEPIGTRLRRWTRRHLALVAASATAVVMALLLMTLGISILSLAYQNEKKSTELALSERHNAIAQQQNAERERDRSDRLAYCALFSLAGKEFLANNPGPARELLDEANSKVASKSDAQTWASIWLRQSCSGSPIVYRGKSMMDGPQNAFFDADLNKVLCVTPKELLSIDSGNARILERAPLPLAGGFPRHVANGKAIVGYSRRSGPGETIRLVDVDKRQIILEYASNATEFVGRVVASDNLETLAFLCSTDRLHFLEVSDKKVTRVELPKGYRVLAFEFLPRSRSLLVVLRNTTTSLLQFCIYDPTTRALDAGFSLSLPFSTLGIKGELEVDFLPEPPGWANCLLVTESGAVLVNSVKRNVVWSVRFEKPKASISYSGLDTLIWQPRNIFGVFAIAMEDHSIQVREVISGNLKRTLVGHSQQISSLAMNRNASRLLTCSKDLECRLWPLSPRGDNESVISTEELSLMHDIAFAAKGDLLVGFGSNCVYAIDCRACKQVARFVLDSSVVGATIASDGNRIIAITDNGVCCYCEIANQSVRKLPLEIPPRPKSWIDTGHRIDELRIINEGVALVKFTGNQEVFVSNLSNGSFKSLELPKNQFGSVVPVFLRQSALLADRRGIAFLQDRHRTLEICKYDLDTAKATSWFEIATNDPGSRENRNCLYFADEWKLHPDGKRLFARQDAVQVFHVPSKSVAKKRFAGGSTATNAKSMDISPDGKLLACGANDGLRVYDVETMLELLHLPDGETQRVSFSANGDILASLARNGLIIRRTVRE